MVLLALLWGYNWVVMKVGLQDAEPFTYSVLRNLFGAFSIFAVAVVMRRPLKPKAIGWTALFGLFQTSGSAGLSMFAVYLGGVGKVSFLTYTMPVWLLLIAWLVLREPIKDFQWLAVGLAVGGLAFLLEPWHLRGLSSSLLAVGAGISWAIASLIVRHVRTHHDVDPLSFIAWQGIFGSVPLIAAAFLTAESLPHWDAGFVSALFFSAVPANAIAWVLWLYALDKLPLNTAGFGSLAVPVVGVFTAWVQLGEQPNLAEGIGMGLIVVGLAVLAAREMRLGQRAGLPRAVAEPAH